MVDQNKGLFWIGDDSVRTENVKKQIGSNSIKRSANHRRALCTSISSIRESNTFNWYDSQRQCDPPKNFIFKAELNKDRKPRHSDSLTSNGITLNYLIRENVAIVSNSSDAFAVMENKVVAYAESGKNKTRFDDFDSLSPNVGTEKISKELQEELRSPDDIKSIRLQMVPIKDSSDTVRWISSIKSFIESEGGNVSGLVISGNMTFIYAETVSESVRILDRCPAILSMTVPRIASVDRTYTHAVNMEGYSLDTSVDLNGLYTVVILDDGVDLPENLDIVEEHFVATGLDPVAGTHGTMVASRLAFGPFLQDDMVLKPRCSIVDYKIINEEESSGVLAGRIREAVEKLHERAKVFILCINIEEPFSWEDDEMSVMIDEMCSKYGVTFFVSMGNHRLWENEDDLIQILEDSDSTLACPADAYSAISVGAVTGESHDGSMSPKDGPSAFGRIGPGWGGTVKPNVVGLSGTLLKDKSIPIDRFSTLISPYGFTVNNGTSFSTPDVAGLFMDISKTIGDSELLMSRAVLYHYARKPEWSCPSNLVNVRSLFGFGIVDENILLHDPRHESILMRRSSIRAGTEEVVTIRIPDNVRNRLSDGHNLKIRITCLVDTIVDRSKGMDSIRATVTINLKGPTDKNREKGEKFWDLCKQKSYDVKTVESNDWCFSIKAYGKGEMKNRMIPYALVVSLVDRSDNVDISSEILSDGRYPILGSIDSRVPEVIVADPRITIDS